ncbi:hypothetical protein C8Q76DRAFT_698519 [Earliella scabrosa]|nr:hypothetical protein C8Q76DRAFT_698519 [Earliella scabrosa]
MASTNFPRQNCVHPECIAHPDGSCADFLVTCNGTSRSTAIFPEEPCSACDHLWYSHRITRDEVEGREDNLRRGASLVTGCGGFFAASDPSSWVGLTVLSAPPQLTTTHPPPTPFFPPGLSLPPSSAGDVAAHSPIFAYGGLPPPAPGRTIDRRNVSAERARNAVAVAHNAPRIRTSGSSRVVSAPVQGSSVMPISPTAHAADDEDEECLNFMLYPMVHPASPDHPGAHPGAVLQFSGERFTQLARQTEAWNYVMTIKLPKTGQTEQAGLYNPGG